MPPITFAMDIAVAVLRKVSVVLATMFNRAGDIFTALFLFNLNGWK